MTQRFTLELRRLQEDKALYFSRADHLGDLFEGAKGVLTNKEGVGQVVVSPFSSPWFEGVMKETLVRFGVSINTALSEMTLKSFF